MVNIYEFIRGESYGEKLYKKSNKARIYKTFE